MAGVQPPEGRRQAHPAILLLRHFSRGDASHCPPAQLFPRAHAGPELQRAAGRARQGLRRPRHSRRGRAASQPAPGARATATWRRPLAIVLYEGRSLCRKKSIRVRCDYRRREDAGRKGSLPCATRRCPGRAPQAPALRPACRAHTTPAPRSPSRGRRLGLRGSASPGSREPCTAAARARATPGSWRPAGGPGPGGRPCPRGHVLLSR